MYWYKPLLKTAAAALLISSAAVVMSCSNDHSTATPATQEPYFALHTFFSQEVKRLKAENPSVEKTVSKDNDAETKTLHIADWERELGSFLSVDMDKNAYQGAFEVQQIGDTLSYSAIDPELALQQVSLIMDPQGKPLEITIQRITNNTLYKNTERLTYKPHQGYAVEKMQDILLLGKSEYHIYGKFQSLPPAQ